MLKRAVLGGAAGMLTLLLATSAGAIQYEAGEYIFEDVIWSRGYKKLTPVTSGAYAEFRDQIGDDDIWQTFAVEIDRNGDMIDFKIYTNKGDPNYKTSLYKGNLYGGVEYADFFIDLSPDDPIAGPFDGWDLAIDFQTGKLYQLNPADGPDWKTSQDIFQFNNSNIYGGLFRHMDCGKDDDLPDECEDANIPYGTNSNVVQGFEAPVQIKTAQSVWLDEEDTKLQIDSAWGDPYGASHVISFSIAASLLNGGSNFDFFWGTGECGNDAIWGHMPGGSNGVPEPLALSLFGLGLAGAAYASRRRRRLAA